MFCDFLNYLSFLIFLDFFRLFEIFAHTHILTHAHTHTHARTLTYTLTLTLTLTLTHIRLIRTRFRGAPWRTIPWSMCQCLFLYNDDKNNYGNTFLLFLQSNFYKL
jgi:hypothetical protein